MPSAQRVYDPPEPAPVGSALDPQILAILEAPAAAYETPLVAFARREARLKALFGTLSVNEAVAMHRRLASTSPGDKVGARFARFTVERRSRILRFLARTTPRSIIG